MKLPEELLEFYNKNKSKIKKRLKEFSLVPKEEYFYELCYCLLTPQSKAENSVLVVQKLKQMDFFINDFDPKPILIEPKHYIRFHNNKAKHLLYAKEIFPQILECIENNNSLHEKRMFLVNKVLGFGMKESSHFLRNIGFKNLAILDRHILKNLVLCGVIDSYPNSLNKFTYLNIEKKFLYFAERINIPIDELDLLFWSVQTGQILK
jgi:N-glycosylase/DNA lyase